jgi:hypothetical protein
MIGIGVCIGLAMLLMGIKVNFNVFIFINDGNFDNRNGIIFMKINLMNKDEQERNG